jgi:hypothetical protein
MDTSVCFVESELCFQAWILLVPPLDDAFGPLLAEALSILSSFEIFDR